MQKETDMVRTGLRITQGTFSYLPDFTDEETKVQIQYGIDNGWAPSVEFTEDPHPRNVYWEMWGMPMFDLKDAAAALFEVKRCREAFPNSYIRVSLYNSKLTKQTTALQFIVHRPPYEPGFRLDRQESTDRIVRYTLHAYALDRPEGERYQGPSKAESRDA
ncbi:MAG: ribulose bisphosphate carboxylase small subunit [Candidatus Dormibacteraceae bacterium]